jgi:hypothetical protein
MSRRRVSGEERDGQAEGQDHCEGTTNPRFVSRAAGRTRSAAGSGVLPDRASRVGYPSDRVRAARRSSPNAARTNAGSHDQRVGSKGSIAQPPGADVRGVIVDGGVADSVAVRVAAGVSLTPGVCVAVVVADGDCVAVSIGRAVRVGVTAPPVQASPRPSVSVSSWSGLATAGQLSKASGISSPSLSRMLETMI